MKIDRDSQLENTLLKATIRIFVSPRSTSRNSSLTSISRQWSSILWASGSCTTAWNTVSWALRHPRRMASTTPWTPRTPRPIAQRFRFWPEAAMTYFGILVSPCKVVYRIPDARVVVVRDHELGTNDCRGWIRRSYFERLHLAGRRFYQFRMSFRKYAGQGSFRSWRTMSPMRCRSISSSRGRVCKPEFKKPECVRQCPTVAGRMSGNTPPAGW